MIFVTVGTHEQPFNRLVEYMDEWAKEHGEEVIIQTGYSTCEPKNCKWSNFYPYETMVEMVKKARIVITHCGPSSFFLAIEEGKTPIIVPRRKEFGEHVNDHQLDFCKKIKTQINNIIIVENIEKLGYEIEQYDEMRKSEKNTSNNAKFCEDLENIVDEMFARKK